MFVDNIKLNNYRNYEQAQIQLEKGINVIYGSNAQGKTNILESIYLFATGRSHRTNKDIELIKFNSDYAKVKIKFINEENDRENYGEIKLYKDRKKRIEINFLPINKLSELMGFFNVVMFNPDDLDLIKEGPINRRRFIDICISQIKPKYFYNLQKYMKILEQRNALLKNIKKEKKTIIESLQIWNEKLSEYGAAITVDRQIFIKDIKKYARDVHLNISKGKENLDVEYIASAKDKKKDNKKKDIKQIKYEFEEKLKENEEKDINNGITSVGPHRDDIIFKLNNLNAKNYGSQGQQRTVVFSLKMAEMEYMKQSLNEYPILLLDDIMSELDEERQKYIIENIENKQVIITCTNINTINIKKDITLFKVKNGRINEGG